MAYIYEKKIHGKRYYYLRVSKRVNGKTIQKDIAYLGNDPTKVEEKLDKLPKKYQAEIRKTYRNIKKYLETGYYLRKVSKTKQTPYLNSSKHKEIEAIKLHFHDKFLKLDKKTQEDTYKGFIIAFAFNTTSIEGNTITLAEAQKLLTEYMTPKNKTLREIHDLQNTEKVLLELIESKEKMSHELIIRTHDELMDNIDYRKGYRTHDTRVFGSRFKSSPAKYVKTDMKIILDQYHKSKLHPLTAAGIFHHKLEKIHPFADGNGRTGRMILNHMLLKAGYPPLIIQKKNRKWYREALSKADNTGLNELPPEKYKELIEYLAEEMIKSYWDNFLV